MLQVLHMPINGTHRTGIPTSKGCAKGPLNIMTSNQAATAQKSVHSPRASKYTLILDLGYTQLRDGQLHFLTATVPHPDDPMRDAYVNIKTLTYQTYSGGGRHSYKTSTWVVPIKTWEGQPEPGPSSVPPNVTRRQIEGSKDLPAEEPDPSSVAMDTATPGENSRPRSTPKQRFSAK